MKANQWQPKAWGEYYVSMQNGLAVMTVNRIVHGGFCSVHMHRDHSNTFVVLQGLVAVGFFDRTGICQQVKLLYEGDGLTLRPTEWHQFYAKEDSVITEFYAVHPSRAGQVASLDDIERFPGKHEGGVTQDYIYKNVPHVS